MSIIEQRLKDMPGRPPDTLLRLRDLRDPASHDRRLRAALKYLWRVFGLRCLEVRDLPPGGGHG
jgi:hypothetical protein